MTTRRDGSSRRSSKNRPPRSPDTDLLCCDEGALDVVTLAMTEPLASCSRWMCPHERTSCSAIAASASQVLHRLLVRTQPIGKTRQAPRIEQCTAEPIRGNAFSLKTSLPPVNLAGLLPECNSHRRTRIAFCIEGFSGAGSELAAGGTTLAVLHGLKHTVDAAVEPMLWFCWFAPRCTCRDTDEPHSSLCALRLSASTSHPAWRAARGHGHCIDGERRGR